MFLGIGGVSLSINVNRVDTQKNLKFGPSRAAQCSLNQPIPVFFENRLISAFGQKALLDCKIYRQDNHELVAHGTHLMYLFKKVS